MTAVAHRPGETCVETGTYVTDCEHEEEKTFNEGETFEPCQVVVDDDLYWHKPKKTGDINDVYGLYQTTCEHEALVIVGEGEAIPNCPVTQHVAYYLYVRMTGQTCPETGIWRTIHCPHTVYQQVREGDTFPPCPGAGAPHAAYWKL